MRKAYKWIQINHSSEIRANIYYYPYPNIVGFIKVLPVYIDHLLAPNLTVLLKSFNLISFNFSSNSGQPVHGELKTGAFAFRITLFDEIIRINFSRLRYTTLTVREMMPESSTARCKTMSRRWYPPFYSFTINLKKIICTTIICSICLKIKKKMGSKMNRNNPFSYFQISTQISRLYIFLK